ncbi:MULTISPECIES: tyrosine-type recombinase/integrase [unclassified Acidocella]|uniref:tyrosine-type recombinase/integrase n=1 Tax=unclassified Acidocella TaxID=2648610 RepID=UPI0003480C86|nr:MULTISPECIES: tyrosine-type recombinase/integrase [unclassified Acidocella]WBO61020.1 tyrosine-type recombinase/integrase [Acidocella sp. MX-AZ03]
MLSAEVDRYIALRRTLGYKLVKTERHLRSYARHHDERCDGYLRAAPVLAWVTAAGRTREARRERYRALAGFARFLHAEDARHELPPVDIFAAPKRRPMPYIYTPDEIARILEEAGRLRRQQPNPLRRELYGTLFGLIAATGLRISEVLALRMEDLRPDGVLHIRATKFGKSRLVPLHATVVAALERYLATRKRVAGSCEYLFPSVELRQLCPSTVNYTFRILLKQANIAPGRARRPRIHDLRHTFATRALERCGGSRGEVARHFVALSTYLGHADIRHTYWYLQATPEMMTDIAAAAEMLVGSAVA